MYAYEKKVAIVANKQQSLIIIIITTTSTQTTTTTTRTKSFEVKIKKKEVKQKDFINYNIRDMLKTKYNGQQSIKGKQTNSFKKT